VRDEEERKLKKGREKRYRIEVTFSFGSARVQRSRTKQTGAANWAIEVRPVVWESSWIAY